MIALRCRVLLMETRPLSATKRWRVSKVLERASDSAESRLRVATTPVQRNSSHPRARWLGSRYAGCGVIVATVKDAIPAVVSKR